MLAMFEGERGGLRANYGAEKQQNDNGPRAARTKHCNHHSARALKKKGSPRWGALLDYSDLVC